MENTIIGLRKEVRDIHEKYKSCNEESIFRKDYLRSLLSRLYEIREELDDISDKIKNNERYKVIKGYK